MQMIFIAGMINTALMKGWKYVWDLILIILFSIIYLFSSILWKRFELLFILFLSGYAVTSFLFPNKKDLDTIERFALSFGLSLAITPILGLILKSENRLNLIPLSSATLTVIFSLLAIYRRLRAEEPFAPSVDLNRLKREMGWNEMSGLEKVLTVVLAISIIVSVAALIYIVVTPKQGEKFTEFYILGPNGKAAGYPTKLRVGQNATVIIGIVNHECRTVNYTVEIWLVNASYGKNGIVIHHMYFFDRFNVTLKPVPINIEGNWTPQWEMRYTFSIDKPGKYKMWFLLFKDHVPPLPSKPKKMKDYAGTKAEKRIFDAINGKIQSLNLNIVVRPI